MTRDETIALFLECEEKRKEALDAGKSKQEAHEAAKAHWNSWAEKMLAERKALEEGGTWKSRRNPLEPEKGENSETQAWLDKAFSDFSRCLFLVRGAEGTKETPGEQEPDRGGTPVKSISLERDVIDFDGFIFPSNAWFESATFSGDARFKSATFSGNARFESATFSNTALFGRATFSVYASFGRATFSDTALFDSATFSVYASFGRATFSGTASFDNATFSGGALFYRATFSDTALFEHATFSDTASFENATFSGGASFYRATFSDTTLFDSATFQNSTSLRAAKFRQDAKFTGIKVDRAFDMTEAAFSSVPAFNQGDFKQAPDLDAVRFPLPGFWRGGKAELIAKYRAIRRMAIQGADYEREQMAFKGELRSRRWIVDKWHDSAFWFGVIYDALSDFGRSMMRPFYLWFLSVIAFVALYFWNAGLPASEWASTCTGNIPKVLKAINLSLANALPVIGSNRSDAAKEFYGCISIDQPAWSQIIQNGQALWSAVLIFLFLLALRNQFKIK
jgi:Pentapeptide repeats (9 copies)